MDEIWKPVPGCEGTYEVSDKGQVRSLPREVKGRTRQGQIRKASSTKDGYLRLNLWVNGKQQSRLVHQLVIEAFIGPPGPDQEVHHVNNNKTDNRLGNLRYVTHKWNVRLYWETNEAVANTLRGNDHPRSKMTEKKVRQLRQDYATGDWTFVNLGKKYGIAPNTAEGIIKRQTWVHVE